MTRSSVARARQQLAHVLDQAEKGETVIIERRGVRFALRAVKMKKARAQRGAARIEVLDSAIEAGSWSWSWSPDGLVLDETPGRS
jgi:antitoxin (DNA-binding transcriptional repressor) of toxin-antitoxin stability system